MKLVLMGTGPFAVPSFAALADAGQTIVGVVTRPDKPPVGKAPPPANPVRDLAKSRGWTCINPDSINSPEAHVQLSNWQADLFVVCDYGQILSAATLALSRLGGINLHGSLLPKYRGAAPIQWAIYHGETETGVTVIHMTPQLDAGPCLVQVRTPIGPDETNAQLEPRLAELGVGAVLSAVAQLESGQTQAIVQDPALASPARRLRKSDGVLDWRRTAQQLCQQIRAWQPWPKSHTTWQRAADPAQADSAQTGTVQPASAKSAAPQRLIIDAATALDEADTRQLLQERGLADAAPGTILVADKGTLIIRCGMGALCPTLVQPAGKKTMPVADFLRGTRLRAGQRLGDVALQS